MVLNRCPWPNFREFDDNGDPLSGGKLYSYIAGSATPLATYDENGDLNSNPVILDTAGRAHVYLDETKVYKLVLKNANDVTIWTEDNLGVNGSGTSAIYNYIQFNTSATPVTSAEGLVQWNSLEKTLDIGLVGGSVLQAGFEELTLVWNNTGSTITNGTPVYATGSAGQRLTVAPIGAASSNASKFFAVATQDIANNSLGIVSRAGRVRDINTNAWSEGDTLWLSATTGQITNSAPAKPNHQCRVGYVEKKSGGAGIILLDIEYYPEIGELSNVSISGITSGQGLQWNSSTELFERGGPWLPLAGNSLSNPVTGQIVSTYASGFYATDATFTYYGQYGRENWSLQGSSKYLRGTLGSTNTTLIGAFGSSNSFTLESTNSFSSLILGDGTRLATLSTSASDSQITLTEGTKTSSLSALYGLTTGAAKAATSAGLLLEASNGTDIGLLGASNSADVTWYGAHTFNSQISVLTNILLNNLSGYYYIGDGGTNGNWRFGLSGNNLVFQRRESTVWVTKATIEA